jgi:hypothetical protein
MIIELIRSEIDKVGPGMRSGWVFANARADLEDRRQQRALLEEIGLRKQRLGLAVEGNPAATQRDGPVGPFRDKAHVMGDHQNCGVITFPKPIHQPHQVLGAFMILPDGRLVQH